MNNIPTTRRSAPGRARYVTMWMAALGLGCAADDGTESDRAAQSPVPTSSNPFAAAGDDDAVGFGDSIDKGLRKDFCCAQKRGNTVNRCYNTTGTKAWVGVRCNALGTDSVVRDGSCSQYASCQGKEICFEDRIDQDGKPIVVETFCP